MTLSLFAAVAVLALDQAQPPQTYALPPSSLSAFSGRSGFQPDGRIVPARRGCQRSANPDEIVVCGDTGAQYMPGPVDPEAERRYGRRPEGPSAGVQMPATAMEASRCGDRRCPPRGMIGILGRRF